MSEFPENPINQPNEQPVTQDNWNKNSLDLNLLNRKVEEVRNELRKVIVGQSELVDLLMIALLSNGHVLIEGVPGIAKTLTAKLMAKTLSVEFSRIQFTPDMMPADVTGTTVFNVKNSEFQFNHGPIFSNIVLIDEINRAPAKTQSSLFEVMEERQISVDGKTYRMDYPFLVIATQNPIEQEGTYKLPEAQLDRFLFRIKITYPNLQEEKAILRRFSQDFSAKVSDTVKAVFSVSELLTCQQMIERIHIKEELIDYIAEIIHGTRNNGDLFLGASPRASLSILKSSKALAAMSGRDFVTPDDIRNVCGPVLNHRIIVTPEREMEGIDSSDVIKSIINKLEVPR